MKEPIYDILIQNTRILTPDMAIRSGVDVAIKDGMISSICSAGSLSCPEAEQTVDRITRPGAGADCRREPPPLDAWPDRRSYAHLSAAASRKDSGCSADDLDTNYASI